MVSKQQVGSTAGGALAGAGTGAAIGSVIPGLGTALGAGIGGAIGAGAGYLSGNKDKVKNINQLTPEQQQLLQNYAQQIMGMQAPGGAYDLAQQYNTKLLSGDPEAYERWAAPYRQEFEQETIPMLSERFAGIGGGLGGGVMGSSGFGQAIGGAGAKFQSNLAHLYENIRQQAADRIYGQYNNLGQNVMGTRAFEPAYQPGSTGFGGQAGAAIMQGLGQYTGQWLGDKALNKKPATGVQQSQVGTGTTFDYKKP